ncbi:DUF975 family protein [Melissococcus plutonius]|uniref:DUF975 family protein n=1 Tax=Melissococcus plutonius TaxID=33970 RepID=UPI003C2D5EC8
MKSAISNSQHRKQAREFLQNQWGMMAWITFLSFFIPGCIGFLINQLFIRSFGSSIINILCGLFIFFAITYGTYFCALQVIKGKRVMPNMLMAVFDKKFYGPLFLINLIQFFVEKLLSLITLLPVFLILGSNAYFAFIMFNRPQIEKVPTHFPNYTNMALLVIFILLYLVILICISIFIKGIFQFSVWLKFDDMTANINEIFKNALYLIKGRFWQYVWLQFSFVGWYIVGFLTIGIGLLWIVPYHNVAISSFYKTAREEKGQAVA